MNRICLIGFGNLGYRYFQAILNLKLTFELSVVDIGASFDKGYSYLSNLKKNSKVKFYKKLNETPKNFDLIIISTTADKRLKLIRDIKKNLKFKYMIMEKPLTQNDYELSEIKKIIKNKKCWVDTHKRFTKPYKFIGNKINKKYDLHMNVEGKNWGICCNSLHYLDLFYSFCYSRVSNISEIKKMKWLKSKRNNYYELDDGIIEINCNNNILKLISENVKKKNNEFVKITILNGSNKWEILEKLEGHYISYKKKNFFFKNELLSSRMTKTITYILNKQVVNLPTFNESASLYKPLIKFFLKKWKIKNKSSKLVPIT